MDAQHADAVARAKAIAARLAGIPSAIPSLQPDNKTAADVSAMLDAALSGGGATTTSSSAYNNNYATTAVEGDDNTATTTGGSTSKKRGVEDMLASLIPGLGHLDEKRSRTTSAGGDHYGGGGGGSDYNNFECTKTIYIPTDKNPGYNYVGLLIGPGGSKQRELVASSGGNVKISIRGKGSNSNKAGSTEQVVAAGDEEPLHVLLEGKQENVDRAEVLVRELLEDSEAADKEKARQLGLMNPDGSGGGGAKTRLVVGTLPNPWHKFLALAVVEWQARRLYPPTVPAMHLPLM